MGRTYWLDLFTGKTWEEFMKHGAKISGFSERKEKTAQKVKPGDYLICYVTGISRFIGVLEVQSGYFYDTSPIWEDSDYPIRFHVKLIHHLAPKTAIPVLELKDKLSIFKGIKSKNAWTIFFRSSLTSFKQNDGEIITTAMKEAIKDPIEREFDIRKYNRQSKTYESNLGIVTVPEEMKEENHNAVEADNLVQSTTHEEIQYLLLKIGSELGLDVWVAKNDKNKQFNGNPFHSITGFRSKLPVQFDDATNKTIELIDVIWLQGDAIIAAFEVEHTTAIYSGLLRMSDLISMQPNIKINLYIVAPDDKRDKVFNEINRPTFARLRPPLPKICKFISYSVLKNKIDQIGEWVKHMKPEFVDDIAESCEPDNL